LPEPRLDRIFPLGGKAGSTLTLAIGGSNLNDVKTLLFDHPGLTATFVKENEFRLTIAADTPPGTHEVHAIGKYGLSASRLFSVSRGLTEVMRDGENTSRDKAQVIPLDTVVNANTNANLDHFYRFTARKGQRIVIDCQAYRLDSTLRPMVTLADADGRVLLRGKPYHDRTDPLLDFLVPADGSYVMSIHDRTFTDDLPYRLVVTTRPQIELVWPPAVQVGKAASLTLFGRNLPGSQSDRGAVVNGLPLDQLPWKFTPPAVPPLRYEYINPVSGADLNGRAIQVWPDKVADALHPVTLFPTDTPVTLEQEPNDTPEKAQPLTLPAVVCGRFDRPGDVDWYRFTAKAEEIVAIDLLCERLGRPGDPVAILRNDKGEDVASFDDFGNNSEGAMSQLTRDATGTFTIPADGTYHLLVHDRFHRGGPRYTYVLRVGKPRRDFYPVVYHEQTGSPTCPTVRQGGCALYEFCLNRRDGFDGMATVEVEGLPKGVTCPPVSIGPNAEFGSIVFVATADAPESNGFLRLKAWATIDGKRIEREVACVQRRWEEDQPLSTRACRRIGLAVRPKAPYRLNAPKALEVQAGGSVEARVTLTRLWPEFKDKVQVTAFKPPPGFEAAGVDIEPDRTEGTVKLTLSADVPPGTYSVVLHGDAQVPFKADPKAGDDARVRVADPAPPVTIVVKAPASK
jgi:hypothetical protein